MQVDQVEENNGYNISTKNNKKMRRKIGFKKFDQFNLICTVWIGLYIYLERT